MFAAAVNNASRPFLLILSLFPSYYPYLREIFAPCLFLSAAGFG